MAWWHQHVYAFKISLQRLAKLPISSLTNVVIMSLALSIPIAGYAIIQGLKPLQSIFNQHAEISIFLNLDSDEAQAKNLLNTLQKKHPDFKLNFISKDKALKNLAENPLYNAALETLEQNPLPHAIIIELPASLSLEHINKLKQELQAITYVDSIQYDQEWAQRLNAIIQFLQTGMWFIALVVGLALLLSVFNTVRIQALSLRAEIRVARLVGATESFVRRPFLYQGLLIGLLSSSGATLIAYGLLQELNTTLFALAKSYGAEFALTLPTWPELAAFIAITSLLGALSARWSVTRHSHF